MQWLSSDARIIAAVVVLALAFGGTAAADPPTHWGDLSIHDGTQYIGEDVYNTDGAGQTVASDANAVYEVRLENVGSAADTFRVARRPGGSSSLWAVTVAPVVEGDLTAQGSCDWVTRLLDVGESIDLEVSVQALPAAPGGAVCDIRLCAWAENHPFAADAVRMQTTCPPTARPDLSFGSSPGGLGTLVYSDDGAGQTLEVTVDRWRARRQFISVVNRANCADTLTITGPAGDESWEVSYWHRGTDVTPQVTGEGLALPLGSGRAACILLRVRHQAWVGGDPQHTALVTATSDLDETRADAVKMVTSYPALARPDLEVSNGSGYVGGGIVSPCAAGQTVAKTVENGVAAVYDLRVTNAGSVAGSFVLRGQASTARWLVSYSLAGTGDDITGALSHAGWSTPTLPPGEYVDIEVSVTPRAGLDGGTVGRVWVTADASPGETVLTLTTCAVTHRPDAVVDGLGDGVINETGDGQTSTRATYVGQTATYHLVVRNAGNVADTLCVTGPGSGGMWRVQYQDTHGVDITAAVTGAGWEVNVARGGSVGLRVLVTPLAGTAANSTRRVSVTFTSAVDPSKVDVVGAMTRVDTYYQPSAHWLSQGSVDWTEHEPDGKTQSGIVHRGEEAWASMDVENDGDDWDECIIVGTQGTATWSVRYVLVDVNRDITDEVTGSGYVTVGTEPGRWFCDFLRVYVTALPGTPEGATFTVVITCRSSNDPAKVDVLRLVCTVADCRPDALVGSTGSGVYNETAEGQTLTRSAHTGEAAWYTVKVMNRGNVDDRILVTGPGGSDSWWVRYREGTVTVPESGTNITADVTGTGWTVAVNAGASAYLAAYVTPLAGAVDGETYRLPVRIRSLTDPTLTDVVAGITVCDEEHFQPDAAISTDEGYLGEGILNTTGEGQTHSGHRR